MYLNPNFSALYILEWGYEVRSNGPIILYSLWDVVCYCYVQIQFIHTQVINSLDKVTKLEVFRSTLNTRIQCSVHYA